MAIHSTTNLSSIELPRCRLQLSEQTLVLALIYPEGRLPYRCATRPLGAHLKLRPIHPRKRNDQRQTRARASIRASPELIPKVVPTLGFDIA
jgi:hypothetical protein